MNWTETNHNQGLVASKQSGSILKGKDTGGPSSSRGTEAQTTDHRDKTHIQQHLLVIYQIRQLYIKIHNASRHNRHAHNRHMWNVATTATQNNPFSY